MASQLPPIYYIIFTVITSLGVLMQAAVLLAMYLAVRRLTNRLHSITDELQPHIVPTVAAARNLMEDISPKLKVATTNIVEASHTLRRQADHVTATLDDLLEKTTAQANRVDEIVTASIDSASHATQAVQHAFAVPIRQASALFAGLKAGFDVLRGDRNSSRRPPEDEYCE
jgi:methyl-accepting chemotaxis protein